MEYSPTFVTAFYTQIGRRVRGNKKRTKRTQAGVTSCSISIPDSVLRTLIQSRRQQDQEALTCLGDAIERKTLHNLGMRPRVLMILDRSKEQGCLCENEQEGRRWAWWSSKISCFSTRFAWSSVRNSSAWSSANLMISSISNCPGAFQSKLGSRP